MKTVSSQRKYFPTSQIIFDNLNIFLAKTFLQCLTTRHSDVCWKVGPIFFIDSWNWFQNTVNHFWISLSNRPLKWNKDEISFSIRSIYLSVWPSRKRKKQFQYKIFISNPTLTSQSPHFYCWIIMKSVNTVRWVSFNNWISNVKPFKCHFILEKVTSWPLNYSSWM